MVVTSDAPMTKGIITHESLVQLRPFGSAVTWQARSATYMTDHTYCF
jgi:hypothetical protein